MNNNIITSNTNVKTAKQFRTKDEAIDYNHEHLDGDFEAITIELFI